MQETIQANQRIRKNDPIVRLALQRCYKRKCGLSGELILDDFDVDHIIPLSLKQHPDKLERLLVSLGLPRDFELDSVLNLIPAKRARNVEKGDRILDADRLRYLLGRAKDRSGEIVREIGKIRRLISVGDAKEVIRGYLHETGVDSEAFVEALYDSLIADDLDFPEEEDVWSKGGSTYLTISRSVVHLEGRLPSLQRPRGFCRLKFRSLKARNITATLSHADIVQSLLEGLYTAPEHNLRGFITGGIRKDGGALVRLGMTSLPLKADEIRQLCHIVDGFGLQYIQSLRDLETTFGSSQFDRSREHERAYRLVKVKRTLWQRMLEFVCSHDADEGQTPWHIFDRNRFCIKVFTRTQNQRFDPGFHVFYHPESANAEEPWHFRHPDEDVCVVAEVLTDPLGKGVHQFGPRGYWDVTTAYDWLTSEFIPKVISHYRLERELSLDEQRPISWFGGRKDPKQPVQAFESGKMEVCPRPDEVSSLTDLRRYVEHLQLEHNRGGSVYLCTSEVRSLYEAVALCLLRSDYRDYHYLQGNLQFEVDWSTPERIYESMRTQARQATAGVYQYITVDCALRCMVVALDRPRVQLTPAEVKTIAEWLSPEYERVALNALLERALPIERRTRDDWEPKSFGELTAVQTEEDPDDTGLK